MITSLTAESADSPLGPKIPKGNDGSDLACTTTYQNLVGALETMLSSRLYQVERAEGLELAHKTKG